jgi:putative transposase
MGRFARVVAVDVPHHVTQRGNGRQVIFDCDGDRITYLALLQQYSELHGLGLMGYCLMSNHVHLIAIPHAQDALAQALKQAHGRYAMYWNARRASSGHVWQGRFYSCPLDEAHLWEGLRYVELNPLRAGMAAAAEEWRWSSARAHHGTGSAEVRLEMDRWSKRWTATEWQQFLAEGTTESEVSALRQCTHTRRPLGREEFVEQLEKAMLRRLAPQKGGRPKKPTRDARQMDVSFVA